MRRSFAIALVAGIGGLVLGMQTTKVATAQATSSAQTYTGTGVEGWHLIEGINLSFADAPTKGYMVRTYLDPNTNCYVYVTENGAIACTPAAAQIKFGTGKESAKGMPSPLIYSPKYNTDLSLYGVDKPFALDRGEQVLAKLGEDALLAGLTPPSYSQPEPVSDEFVRLVHTAEYLQSLDRTETWLQIFEFKDDEYQAEKARIALPELIHDLRLKCGGTLAAADLALSAGLAANLGGGYHHAFPDRGRGYCVLHDIAIAIKSLQKQGKIETAMTVDLDFHQGDGTALIFARDESVFTFSVHSEEGWPEEKQESDLDLPIRERDAHLYLEYVEKGLSESLRRMTPDMVIYVAGSDPYEKDVLPGTKFLRLPLETMKERDFFVIDTFARLGIPLAMVFAGGYGPHVWEVHYWAVRRLLERSGV